MLDHLHDDAWIREASIGGGGGGGFGGAGTGIAWLPDNKRALFLSEKDGCMHVYSIDVSAATPAAKPLTSGKWEVASAQLSADRKTLFLTTSEVHPGERHFYTMSVDGGPRTKLTTMTGSNEATVSPDEKSLAIVYWYTTKPPELYVMPFAAGARGDAGHDDADRGVPRTSSGSTRRSSPTRRATARTSTRGSSRRR